MYLCAYVVLIDTTTCLLTNTANTLARRSKNICPFVFKHATLMLMKAKTSDKIRAKERLRFLFIKYWWIVGVVVLFFIIASLVGYNKYLDQQNISNMKQLLAEFEQLEIDAENETGQELYIQADCGTGGEKFSRKYICSVSLPAVDNNAVTYSHDLPDKENCETLINGKEGFRNALNCTVSVRGSNHDIAEDIFYKYDTSPGRAF